MEDCIGDYIIESELTYKPIPSHPFIKIAEQVQCKGLDHLNATLKEITQRNGEGVILRKKNSFYLDTDAFYKYKVR
jgi:ATP-dependent DNA ligase